MGRLGRTTRQYYLDEYQVAHRLLTAIKRAPWFKARVREIVRGATSYSPPLTAVSPIEGDQLPPLSHGRQLVLGPVEIQVVRKRAGRQPYTPPPTAQLRATGFDGQGRVCTIEYDVIVLN